ncbi:MAG: ASKHA domain-containing protein [Gallionella sp.]|nr:ASKHA domain-containing protein [Gallionella sp.]
MGKVEIRFLPQNKVVDAAIGSCLMQVAREAFIDIESSCSGKGTCGKCLVQLVDGRADEPHPEEIKHISGENLAQGVRLACRLKVTGVADYQVLGVGGKKHRILSEGLMPEFNLNPNIRKEYIELEKPKLEDNLDDVSRLERALGLSFSEKLPLSLLQQIPGVLRSSGFKATLVLAGGELVGIEPGDTTSLCYGAAVDIGTTTVVVSLVNLVTGEELAACTMINPQKNHGLDVLSRIQHVREYTGGLDELSRMVRECIDTLITEACKDAEVERHNIYEISVAANSTMMHFFLGVDPSGIGKSPYVPAFTRGVNVAAQQLGLAISPFGSVYCLPSVSAYIGADIVAGILCAELADKDERALFIDIGTNGEIAFSSKGKICSCSTAAGPALEGMNISCGMRAANGAIEKVFINDDVEVHTIGGKAAVGLCGSGIIDAVGELIKAGVVMPSGRFVKLQPGDTPPWAHRLQSGDGPASFLLSAGKKGYGPIAITQKDIRQVQLAKGAILSGILALLSELGIGLQDIDRVYIAGAFGFHVRMESFARLGVIPKELLDRISLIGNSSKSGAILCLLSKEKREEAARLARKIEYTELSCFPDYDKLFTKCLSFPSVEPA